MQKGQDERPTWDEYFMGMVEIIKKRATCKRRQVGAIVVKDNRILTTGYNGVPSRVEHCYSTGCIREQMGVPSGEKHELCRGVHAEQNALLQAAKTGVSVDGATIYVTTQPCILCTKMIINAGIERVVYREGYPDQMSLDMLLEACVELEKYGEEQEVEGEER